MLIYIIFNWEKKRWLVLSNNWANMKWGVMSKVFDNPNSQWFIAQRSYEKSNSIILNWIQSCQLNSQIWVVTLSARHELDTRIENIQECGLWHQEAHWEGVIHGRVELGKVMLKTEKNIQRKCRIYNLFFQDFFLWHLIIFMCIFFHLPTRLSSLKSRSTFHSFLGI